MTLKDSVKKCLTSHYACMKGRASRSEFWWYALAIWIVEMIIQMICCGSAFSSIMAASMSGQEMGIEEIMSASSGMIVLVIFGLAVLCPSICVMVRRLHDTGRSGWWWFVSFIPFVGGIILLVFMILESAPANQYGEPETSNA